MDHLTRLLTRAAAKDRAAQNELCEIVYDELRSIAQRLMGRTRGHTLDPTAVVHEAWIRLFRSERASWKDKRHFRLALCATMRTVLVDHARSKETDKRRPTGERVPLDALIGWYEDRGYDVVVLDEALNDLEKIDPRAVRITELRFFHGLGDAQISEILGVTMRTVERDWSAARAWLSNRLDETRYEPG